MDNRLERPASRKLRIALICHFMNKDIQARLGMSGNEKEHTPWITIEIEEIKKRDDVELHVIAPFIKIFRSRTVRDGNIHYHCIRVGMPLFRRHWPGFFMFHKWTNFFFFNIRVKWVLRKIRPDIVNLKGAENAPYSSSILGVKGYPVIITIQGFVSLNYEEKTKDPMVARRIEVEQKILRNFRNFGIETRSMENYIRTFNPDARMFWFHFPFSKSNVINDNQKEYDLVFFARLTKMKGVDDLIKAVSILKPRRPDIRLCVIGRDFDNYTAHLKELVRDLEVEANVHFGGFLATQEEMHKEVVKARISVLPTYNDTIPGTIVESLLLGIPVISYETGGIPDLNLEGEHVILVEQGNVEKLAEEIDALLNDPSRQKELAERAKKYAEIEFDNTRSVDLMIKAYREIISGPVSLS